MPIGGKAKAVAGVAKVLGHRGNETYGATSPRQPIILSRAVAGFTGIRLKVA